MVADQLIIGVKKLLKKITPGFLIRAKHYFEQRYYRYHPATISLSMELSKETGIPYLALLFDMNLSVLSLVVPEEYRMYRFYDKSRRARDRFLTEYRVPSIVAAFNCGDLTLMKDKRRFNSQFPDFIGRQWLYAPEASDQQIKEFLDAHKQIIVKPPDGNCGIGVRKIVCSDITDVQAFCESVRKDGLMLEEVVVQHPDVGAIHPASVNTVRIHTIIDKAGTLHILRAGLRMGVGQSITDNLDGSGAIVAQVDLDSGILFTPAIGKDSRTYIKHPTTGIVLPGFQIPHWEAAKDMVLCAARRVPQIRWIGWDVAVTEKGPLLIEGNSSFPGPKAMQLATQTGIYYTLRSYL